MFRIAVPAFTVEKAYRDILPPANKSLVLMDAPADHTKTIISLLLTPSEFTHDEMLRTGRGKKISILGTVQLTHETAWLVASTDPMTDYEIGWLENLVRTTTITLAPGGSKESITFAQLHSFEVHLNPPAIIDIAMGRGNVEITPAI